MYSSTVKILSPAKINLYLNILGRRPDRFHNIESIVERISLCDEITVKVKKDLTIDLATEQVGIPKSKNLCVKAAQLLTKKFKFPFGFDIYLKKNIPVGSGLGGGSSNAASTILAIMRLLDLKLKEDDLYSLGAKLGSDVNFFLSQSRFAFVWGRGEKIRPFKAKKLNHLIVWPKISLSTKKVYQNLKVSLTKYFNNVKILNYALKKGDILLIKKSIFNGLEKSAFSLCAQLRSVKEYLNRKGFSFWMTGSGSALYTVLDKKLSPKVVRLFPKKWQIFEAQTF